EQASAIWVADAQGNIRAGSREWDRSSSSIAGRDYFQAQRERDAGTFVSSAYQGLVVGKPAFALSRRRSTPDGQFDGTIHIGLEPDYFARFYADAAPGLLHTGALVRADGEVLIWEPPRTNTMRLGADSAMMQAIAARPEEGFSVGTSRANGAQRMFAYRKVAGYPLYVVLSVDTAVVLQRWHAHLAGFAAVAATASLALLLLSWLALRGVRSERAATARLRTTLDELQQETAKREAAEGRVRQAQRMEAVGQLTAGIAHDFNNLLTAVLGSLQMLQKRLPAGDERAARLLSTAQQGAQRGAALTQRLLAFGRGQALKPEAVDMPTLVQGMSGLLRSSLGSNVQIGTRFPTGVAPARVDAGQLEVALLNLAVNARDAMPGGGQLTITAREERVGSGYDGELSPGGYVVLDVSDTGAGMDAATLARCVEPFFTTKGVGKGTGLGLSMVHGLAAQSGGRLVLRSQKGKGTTAELWLPQVGAEAALAEMPETGAADPRPRPLDRHTVLLVDDDPLVLASAASMLEDLGHAVVETSSGRQALEILRAGAKVDLVLTDQAMPCMTGQQLAAELRHLRPSLPVLLATGHADTVELAASGMPLLRKPFGQAAMAVAIEGCLATPPSTGGQIVQFRAR
ncbi:MAG: ATP-binding protein, partial [Janthinobacterium lividum]